jgi:hypothetical protein
MTFMHCGPVGKPKDVNPDAGYVILIAGSKSGFEFSW